MDLSKIISQNVSGIQSDIITVFNQQVENIPDLIPLTLGEPDFNTPGHIKEAAIRAIKNDKSHYTNPMGIFPLRQAATDYMAKKYDVHFDPETEALATTGVSEAILDTFKAILDDGDEIIVPTPAFPVYEGSIKILGAEPIFVDTSKDNFKLTPELLQTTLAQHPHAKAILINFPSNPTGKTYDTEELKALSAVLKNHNIIAISDEIYSELTYPHHHISLAQFLPEQTVVFNGLSKSHAMTGWRLGMVFAPKDLMEQIAKVHVFNTFNVPLVVQEAGVEAFRNGQDDALPMKNAYEKRQQLVLAGLKKAGIEASKPEGAFYIFAKIPSQYDGDDYQFCLDLAERAHVGVIPGSGFGPGGENYFRLSYATSEKNLSKAMQRIQNFTANL